MLPVVSLTAVELPTPSKKDVWCWCWEWLGLASTDICNHFPSLKSFPELIVSFICFICCHVRAEFLRDQGAGHWQICHVPGVLRSLPAKFWTLNTFTAWRSTAVHFEFWTDKIDKIWKHILYSQVSFLPSPIRCSINLHWEDGDEPHRTPSSTSLPADHLPSWCPLTPATKILVALSRLSRKVGRYSRFWVSVSSDTVRSFGKIIGECNGMYLIWYLQRQIAWPWGLLLCAGTPLFPCSILAGRGRGAEAWWKRCGDPSRNPKQGTSWGQHN